MASSNSAVRSAAMPSSYDAVRASSISSIALYGAGVAPCTFMSAMPLPRARAASHASPRSISGRSTVVLPVTTDAAHVKDCSRKSAGSKIASAMPSSKACLALSMRFWFIAFSTMTVTALSAPIRFGSSWLPPQPGIKPRNTSGNAMAGTPADSVR